MSYKVCVKQFRPDDEGLSLHHRHDLDTLNSNAKSCTKRQSNSISQQQAVRRYICKLLKSRRSKNSNDRQVASERNTSLDSVNQTINTAKGITSFQVKHRESPIKKLYHDIFQSKITQSSNFKYLISEPTPIIKQNHQQTVKSINLDKTYLKRKIYDSHGFSHPEHTSEEKRHLLRELNLNKVLEKYHNKVAVEASRDCFESATITPPNRSNQRSQSWGTTMYKIKNKLAKVKTKQKNYDIKINHIETNSISLFAKEKQAIKKSEQSRRTKRVTKQKLKKIKGDLEKKKLGEKKQKQEDFDPWSTEDIRLSDAIDTQRLKRQSQVSQEMN